MLATKSDNLSLIPQTKMWKEKNHSLKLFSDLHVCAVGVGWTHLYAHVHTHMYMWEMLEKKIKKDEARKDT